MKYTNIGNGIMNTQIPVKEDITVSLSYSLSTSSFMSIGTKEQPQGAILFYGLGIQDLFSFEDGANTRDCQTQEDIEDLIAIAGKLTPTHCIYVFDTKGKEAREWLPRFITQEDSKDMERKLEYLSGIYTKCEVKVCKL